MFILSSLPYGKGTDVAALQPLEIHGTIANGRQVSVRGEADRNTPAVRQQYVADLVGGVNGAVPLQTQKHLADILSSYEDVFSQSNTDLERTTIVSHSIDTGEARPFGNASVVSHQLM